MASRRSFLGLVLLGTFGFACGAGHDDDAVGDDDDDDIVQGDGDADADRDGDADADGDGDSDSPLPECEDLGFVSAYGRGEDLPPEGTFFVTSSDVRSGLEIRGHPRSIPPSTTAPVRRRRTEVAARRART